MRKKLVTCGIIFVVVGVSLFFYGFNSTFWLTFWDTSENIPIGKYLWLNLPGVETGMRVHSEYTASSEVRFYILDENNFVKFETFLEERILTDHQFIHDSVGESESYTFSATKDDTYYIVLIGSGEDDVMVTVEILTERTWIKGLIYFLALLIGGLGLGCIIGGLIHKPKKEEQISITPLSD